MQKKNRTYVSENLMFFFMYCSDVNLKPLKWVFVENCSNSSIINVEEKRKYFSHLK